MSAIFKVDRDENNELGLYRRISSNKPGAMQGWEKIAVASEFCKIAELLLPKKS